MYRDHFGFSDLPFSIAPDPRFLYLSARHREAIAHLRFGVGGNGGIVLLTGEIGSGKTTLCRKLIEQIDAACDVAIILNPRLSVGELLETICNEFAIEVPRQRLRVKTLVDAINYHLLGANAAGRRAVLIIDEAQNLNPAVLEQLRLLTNLETNTRKLLQIVLVGQPELADMLARPDMRQVAQRIVARYHLDHLARDDIGPYVDHRLRVAGSRAAPFPAYLCGPLYRATHGVPRLINLVCDRALLGAYAQDQFQVSRETLRQATREVLGPPFAQGPWRRYARQLTALGALGIGAALVAYSTPDRPAAGVAAPEPAAARALEPVAREPKNERQTPLTTLADAASDRATSGDALIAFDSRNPSVESLRRALALLVGGPTQGPVWFDEELLQTVKKFQRAEGIAADGVVGAITLQRLQARLARHQTAAENHDVLHP